MSTRACTRCKEEKPLFDFGVNKAQPDGRTLAWKPLRDWCNAPEDEIKKVFDANYGTVNSYPLQAWLDVYAIDLSGLFAETV